MTDLTAQVRQAFRQEFGSDPEVITRAPGRVNLIGEHTDYNDGFVLPVAIDLDVRVAMSRREDKLAHVYASNFRRRTEFSVENIRHHPGERWSHYQRGVALALQQGGFRVGGFDAALEGNVPAGAGLSSSAAVEVATATALRTLFALDIDPVQLALLCQRAENEFVGVNSGIMDQFISALGKRDTALFLDCRSLETRHVPLHSAARIIVADTAVKRGLVDSEYNQRRAECEAATRLLAQRLSGVKALRDVDRNQFEQQARHLPERIRRRARHVITENARVLASVEALDAGNLEAFGQLMYESHNSLRVDYEVTVPQLDIMVQAARTVPGVLGSRMTGAGFGGCTVSLVRSDAVEQFLRDVPEEYQARTGIDPKVYVCRAVDGASLIAV